LNWRRIHKIGIVLLLQLLTAGVVAVAWSAPAQAGSPGAGVPGVTRLCGPDAAYGCTTGGYAGKSTGWPGAKYGAGYASSNQYGYHNCTLYAAYRIAANGAGDPGWSGNANQWDEKARAAGTAVNGTAAVGAVAQWNSGSAGHVAYVEVVTSGYIEVTDDNYGLNHTDRWRINVGSPSWPENFIHFKDVPVTTTPQSPATLSALTHGSRVLLRWATSGGAADYLVYRDGTLLTATSGTTLTDVQISPNQSYAYAVEARNSAGSSAPATLYVQTRFESADRVYPRMAGGQAACGRAGDQGTQTLVCTLRRPDGWSTVGTTSGDWGYAGDRNWLSNADGTVSYCRRVNYGDQARCDTFDGTGWTESTSPRTDLGYDENRAYLSTASGLAVCGRTGDQNAQTLACTVKKATGWSTVYSPPGDWGYRTDRAWLTDAAGNATYCRRVNYGDQARCDTFDGTAWSESTTPRTDLGYGENRAYLSTGSGLAVCGRAGDQSYQSLVCTVRKATGWSTVYSPAGDWGYSSDRDWLVDAAGNATYCRRVNYGDQARCDTFDGSAWTASTSPRTDLGYGENRSYLSTAAGLAICGRTGDQSSQSLACTVKKATGWSTVYAPAGDWGYATDRNWLTDATGNATYCRRVNYGDQARCETFDGSAWTSSTTPRTDLGYPDSFD
jgi:surface antigen